jgi:hypothetical protein
MPSPPPEWLRAHDFTGREKVWMPQAEMDTNLVGAVIRCLPVGATFGFNIEGGSSLGLGQQAGRDAART